MLENRRQFGMIVGLSVALCACATTSEHDAPYRVVAEPPPEAAVVHAREVVDALAAELMTRLFRELEDGTATDAIDVCSEVAQALTSDSTKDGLTVRRVSLRVRNPLDEPDAYERDRLEELQALKDAGELPQEIAQVVVQEGERSMRYLRPIVVMPPCLACHGSVAAMEPGVLEAVSRRYPDDRAVGYAVGDLRGAFSVTIELER